jgi:hypothetical protein
LPEQASQLIFPALHLGFLTGHGLWLLVRFGSIFGHLVGGSIQARQDLPGVADQREGRVALFRWLLLREIGVFIELG